MGRAILIGALISTQLHAGTIVNITRRLRMSAAEAPPPKDFFIDMGHRDGVREGDVLTVFRWLPVVNVMAGSPHQLMRVPLGEIKILSSSDSAAVGRIASERSPNDLPAMESQAFMMGDQVERHSQEAPLNLQPPPTGDSSKSSLPFQ